jgi:uncharacterized protein
MADYQTIRTVGTAAGAAAVDEGLRAHMNKVYGLMSVAMLITGGMAWAIAGVATTVDPSQAAATLPNGTLLTSFGSAIYLSALRWVIMLAPLAMVFGFGAAVNRLSTSGAQLYFYVFAGLFGLSLSSIFLVFTGASIVQTFLVTSIAFAGLSLYGYTTKRSLSAMGSFLVMGMFGLFVAMLVNLFLQSAALDFAISAIGVLIFAGLTAWDTQKIKGDYVNHAQHGDSDWLGKSAIMGALTLYLDFINMFMFLLRFMGNRE